MKKILLSSLLAVMAVTSANAKIASTDYVDEVAQAKADAAQAAAVLAAATDATSKADAAKTAAEAAANTYTNQKIGDLDATTNGNGDFVIGVAQTDGKVTVTKGNIDYSDLTGTPTVDTAMSDSSTNAVQNKVIKSYVDNAINTVEGEIGGGYQKLSDKLKSSDTATQVTDLNKDTLYPSVGKTQMIADAAQAAAVLAAATDATSKADAAKTAAEAAANTYTNQKIGDLDATTNGSGDFVIGVTQTDGKVTVTKGNIAYSDLTGTPTVDTAMSDSSTNAVQNKVIKSYVDNNVSGKVSINQGEANKDKGLIVNASGELQLADVATDAELEAVSAVADQAKLGVSEINLSDVMKSGITAAKVTTYDGYATGKQDTLTTAQLAAANSGITAALVATYNAYDDRIEQNKDDIASITTATVATVGEEDGQYVLTKKVVDGAITYSWESIDRTLAN